uniref:mannan endo-1,4-beta-mannosidase n=1 Tax=Auxenochlorella protothecoides TaxID=3075 RepID=A0A1D2A9E3_AUXPR
MACRGMIALLLAAMVAAPALADRRLLAASSTPALGATQPTEPEYFITIKDGDFVNGCELFFPAGWNQWEVVEAAGGAPYLSGASLPANLTGPGLVRELLDRAQANGLNTMRTWAFTVDERFALQTAPGEYNEAVFRGLDYLLDEARQRGIKLILAFTSNWTPVGGLPQYLEWAGETAPVQFYTNPSIASLFKAHVTAVTSRVNTINGRRYSEDPTIFAWNLINEPRCTGCPAGTIAAWVKEMAAFVKQADPNHLLTVGEDGFFAAGGTANPGVQYTEWAAEEGQDFIADHSSPDIDFATFHTWVDNWQEVTPEWQSAWIAAHADAAEKTLKKPVLQEEFGKWVNETDPDSNLDDRLVFMQAAYDQTSQLQRAGSALKGSLFWQWYADGQIAPLTEGGGRGLYGIYESDAAFRPVVENAAVAAELSAPVAGCRPAGADVPPPANCSDTWVDGAPETGMEGPTCALPINECVRGTDTCAPEAACLDDPEGFACACFWGYAGDGETCAPDAAALKTLASAYWSEPEAGACDPGADVAWPSDAPGYRYDALGAYTNDYGSRANVSLLECQIACQMAPTCESITYNAVQETCFLKRSQCPIYNFCYDPKEIMCNSTESRAGEVIEYSIPCGFWLTYYRLDMDVDAACAAFTYPGVATGANPDVVDGFREFAASPAAAELDHFMIAPAVEPEAEAAVPAATTPAASVTLVAASADKPT